MRKFECPNCGYVHIMTPKGGSQYKKKVTGFTCPSCGYKVTPKDVRRKRGSGPKPPSERRNRTKQNDEPKEPVIVVSNDSKSWLDNDIIEFKTRDQEYDPSAGLPLSRMIENRSYQPHNKPPRPTDRSLEEALMLDMNIVPSAEIPREIIFEDHSLKEIDSTVNIENEREKVKVIADNPKLSDLVERLNRIEGEFTKKIQDLETRNIRLETELQTFSTLLSQTESLLEHYDRRKN